MDAMKDAIKTKRTGGLLSEGEHQEGDGSPLRALISGLSPEQKQELYDMLCADMEGGDMASGKAVAEGAPTSDEKARIQEKMANEPEPETDDMLAGDVRGLPEKPRNMGERANVYAKERMAKRGRA